MPTYKKVSPTGGAFSLPKSRSVLINWNLAGRFVGNAFMHSASVTFLSGYFKWKNVGQNRRTGFAPAEMYRFWVLSSNGSCPKPEPSGGGTARRPTVLTDHFPPNEPRMLTDLSERINPFPTNTPEGIPFNISPTGAGLPPALGIS